MLTPDAALFLDVDGTLFELVSHPREVTGESGLTLLLQRLQRALGGALALVTGRTLEDIDRIFHGLPLPVAALHGAVRRDHSGRVHNRIPPGGMPQRLREGLSQWVEQNPGAWLEDKGDALALHYRGDPSLAEPAREWIEDLLRDAGE
ncbi:MAG: HAD-IIB family hydrolase, partial [Gammaproteobacteria bacterium]